MDEFDLLKTLGHVKNLIRKNDFDSLLWAGDINADFLRRTSHTTHVQDVVEELGLTRSWDKFAIDFTHCHELLETSHVSILDHFFWSAGLDENVTDAGVLHLPENQSDHSPIYCVLEYQDVHHEDHEEAKQKPRPNWRKASQEQKSCYKVSLEDRISQLDVPPSVVNCKDVKCTNDDHKKELDIFTLDLLEAVQEVAEENLPMPVGGGKNPVDEKKKIPGWREIVSPFREEAYFWHQVWVSYGRPLNTDIHLMMKKTRNRHHYQYKKCRKAEEKVKRRCV